MYYVILTFAFNDVFLVFGFCFVLFWVFFPGTGYLFRNHMDKITHKMPLQDFGVKTEVDLQNI